MNARDIYFQIDSKLNKTFIVMMFIGLVGLIGTFYTIPARAWVNILIVNFFFLCLGLFGIFMLALKNIVEASFLAPYRKVLEALAGTVPYFSLSMLTILIGSHTLYEWTHIEVMLNDKILIQKMGYLNLPFFTVRMLIYLGLWSGLSCLFLRKYRQQEEHPENELKIQEQLKVYSAIGMVLFAITFCMASFDWIMSLEPHWFSTIFGIFTFSGMFVSGIATSILVIVFLQGRGYLVDIINENHFHDLGKLLFGFCTFWAYIWFCQYMLIWYSNIPEEVEYYVLREHFGWSWLFWFNVVINWVVPFLLLLPRPNKRNKTLLQRVSIIILLGQWLNLYIMVAPKVYEHHGSLKPSVSWPEVLILTGYAGFFLFVFFKKIALSPLVPKNSPYLEEGLALEQ